MSTLIFYTISVVLILVAIVFSIISFKKYNNLIIKYELLQHKIEDNSYVENNVILRNAVLEGCLYAEEKNNKFEVKAYRKLLKKLKGED